MTRPILNLMANAFSITASNYPNDHALWGQILSHIKNAGGAANADVSAVTGTAMVRTRPMLNLLANSLSITASSYPNDQDLSSQILTTLKNTGGAANADISACHALN